MLLSVPADQTAAATGARAAWSAPVSRRSVLGGMSLLPLAAAVPGLLVGCSSSTSYRYFSAHQIAVLDAATRRLVPGPKDDPHEKGHPGAHEADVVRYLDTMLSVFDDDPAEVHAGGPWSDRSGGKKDYMEQFVPLNRAQTYAWHKRIHMLRKKYTSGIKQLDHKAGGNFTKISHHHQDKVLTDSDTKKFTDLLFGHTIEAMYGNPEYGGNKDLVGWKDISFPGDSQTNGYTKHEVEAAEPDKLVPTGVVKTILGAIGSFTGGI
jgi:hypothetical protein